MSRSEAAKLLAAWAAARGRAAKLVRVLQDCPSDDPRLEQALALVGGVYDEARADVVRAERAVVEAMTGEAERERYAKVVEAAEPFIGREWAATLAAEIRKGSP